MTANGWVAACVRLLRRHGRQPDVRRIFISFMTETNNKSAAECLEDVFISDELFVKGFITFEFWKHAIELNKKILCDRIENEYNGQILTILKSKK